MKFKSLQVNPSFIELELANSRGKLKPIILPKWFFWIIALLLVTISIIAWQIYFQSDLTLAYNDARSHLNIARRIVDNLQPGFAQIGSVWLPLFHVLELPFVLNEYLWQSGIAGSIISMASYIFGGLYVFGISKELQFDKKAILVSLLIYALNPNLTFMQTTPMTESLLLFLSTASIYYLIKWVKHYRNIDLILSAVFTFLATLTRYDGWFLFLFIFSTVILVSYKKRDLKFAEGNMFLYASLAGFGIVLWLAWNWIIFGDPIYFATGPFSAKTQQDVLLAEGRLYSKGNLPYSTFIYLLTMIQNIGIWIFLVSSIGLVYFITTKKYSLEIKLATSLLLVPVFFNILSLFAGHSVIHLPNLPPYTWFNDRYGLMVLPAVAVFSGFLVVKRGVAFLLVSVIIATQIFLFYSTNSIITIEDGVRGASGQYLDDASSWIQANVANGLVLVAASSNDALLFKSGLPLKNFITEGAQEFWTQSLIDPTTHATWIVMHKGDLVYEALHENPLFLNNYRLVYKDRFTYIYQIDGNTPPLEFEQLPQ